MKYLLLLALITAAALAQQQQAPAFRLPDSVDLKADIVYARYGSRELRLDLYLPKQGTGPFPAVVYIHGGGWSGGNKNQFRPQAAHMATRGFVGACIQYRLSGEAQFPAALHDAKAAVRWLRANAKTYRVDPDRIGAAGGSAGGHLVAMLGTSHKVREFEGDGGNPGVSSRVRAVAAFNPAVDLVSFGKTAAGNAQNAVTKFLGTTYADNAKLWGQATPITHVSKQSAVFMFLHGDADTTVPYRQSVDMLNALKAAGVKAELFTAKGAAHGFFNRPPWFEPTLQQMEEFFIRELR